MSKHLSLPTSRLICLGGAKISTNATFAGDDEGEPESGYGE
jgi:hypothetical protein